MILPVLPSFIFAIEGMSPSDHSGGYGGCVREKDKNSVQIALETSKTVAGFSVFSQLTTERFHHTINVIFSRNPLKITRIRQNVLSVHSDAIKFYKGDDSDGVFL